MSAYEKNFCDVSDVFDFDEQSLDYYDAPLSGWLRHKGSGEWFAFDCQPIIRSLLWHWTLVPAPEKSDLKGILMDAASSDAGVWLSIVEDRRGGSPVCSLVTIEARTAKAVVFAVQARDG